MKINIKPKAESTDQYTMRLGVSLIGRLNNLRTRAADLGADFNATQAEVMSDFATELENRFADMQETNARTHANTHARTHTDTTNPAAPKPIVNGAEQKST